jgi:excisionase family DNA binding protein
LDRLLTVEQAAERLGTSVRFVRRLVFQRRIAYVKLGRYVRIPADDLAVSSRPAAWRSGSSRARRGGGRSRCRRSSTARIGPSRTEPATGDRAVGCTAEASPARTMRNAG